MDPRQTSIYKGFLIVSMLVALITIYFFYHIKRQYRKYKNLESEKLDAEIKTSFSERLKIATELHNDIAPMLSVLMYKIQSTSGISDLNKEEIINSISFLMDRIRQINKGLAPIQYYGSNITDAIRSYMDGLQNKGLKMTIYEEELPNLDDERNEVIFRILQEIILNSLKHAQAKHLTISFSQEKNTFLIKTADDGIGYHHERTLINTHGYGLLSMMSKVSHLGGSLHHDTNTGNGSRYVIEIPVAGK